jgi:hypothetical protein
LLSLFSTLLYHKEPLRHVKGVSGVTSIPDVIGRGCALRLLAKSSHSAPVRSVVVHVSDGWHRIGAGGCGRYDLQQHVRADCCFNGVFEATVATDREVDGLVKLGLIRKERNTIYEGQSKTELVLTEAGIEALRK